MHRITDKLYLGDWINANDVHFLEGNEIKAILNLCSEKDTNVKDILNVYYHIIDGHGTTEDQLYYAVRTLDDLVEENGRVLVHCLAGISRSPTVTAIYIAWKTKVSFDDALDFIAKARPIIDLNRHFLELGPQVLRKLRGY